MQPKRATAGHDTFECRPCHPGTDRRCARSDTGAACATCRRGQTLRQAAYLISAMNAQRFVLGVDLGGTKISVGAMDTAGGRAIALRSEPTLADQGADAVVARIAKMIGDVMRDTMAEKGADASAFLGVGIGSPGPLNRAKGIVITTPNLGWHDFLCCATVSRRPSASRHARQRRQLRDARRVVAGRRARRTQRRRPHDRHRDRRRPHPRRQALPRLERRRRRDRAHDHRFHRPALQVRQLWLPRGIRVRSGDRRAGARDARRAAAKPSLLPQMAGGDLTQITAQHVYEASKTGDDVAREVVRETARLHRHRRREPPQHLQPRRRGARGRRGAGRRRPVRPAARRSSPSRLQARGGGLPHRARRARRCGGRGRCGRDLPSRSRGVGARVTPSVPTRAAPQAVGRDRHLRLGRHPRPRSAAGVGVGRHRRAERVRRRAAARLGRLDAALAWKVEIDLAPRAQRVPARLRRLAPDAPDRGELLSQQPCGLTYTDLERRAK